MKNLLVGLFCLIPGISFAAPETIVHIGRLDISLPMPTGFAPVTPEMKAVNQVLDATTYPDNERLAHFIPERDASAALDGELPDSERSLSVQTPKKMMERAVTKSDFAHLTKDLLKHNSDIIKKIEKDMPNFVKQVDAKLKALDPDLKLPKMSFAPLPAHQTDERVLAYSIFMTMQTAAGPMQIACTANILHVKARLLYVYAYAAEKELAWTRDISKQWVASILAANPSPPELAKLEQHGPSMFRVPENTLLRNIVIGAIAGGIVGLIKQLSRKKKQPTT